MVPGAERFLQADNHGMERAGLELDGLARLDFQSSCYLSHLRHAILHLHLMDFEFGRNVRRSTDQPIGRRSVVLDLHVAGGNARSLRGGPGPWIGNVERASLVVAGSRGANGQGEGRGKEKSDTAHLSTCRETRRSARQ